MSVKMDLTRFHPRPAKAAGRRGGDLEVLSEAPVAGTAEAADAHAELVEALNAGVAEARADETAELDALVNQLDELEAAYRQAAAGAGDARAAFLQDAADRVAQARAQIDEIEARRFTPSPDDDRDDIADAEKARKQPGGTCWTGVKARYGL